MQWEEHPKTDTYVVNLGRWKCEVKKVRASWRKPNQKPDYIWLATFDGRRVAGRGSSLSGCPGYFRTLESAQDAVLKEARYHLESAMRTLNSETQKV